MRFGTNSATSTVTTALVMLSLLLVNTWMLTAQAQPITDSRIVAKAENKRSPKPTPLPRVPTLKPRSTPDEVYEFYSPRQLGDSHAGLLLDRRGTPVERQDKPSVPLSSLGPPTFPADIPSCPKCQERYSSLSSCMGASAVFANASSIFNNPIGYINVIKCACTDTFQAVYPQCLDCFQRTDQCYYLGTDPQGTGANDILSNVRNICGLGSALLGGVASVNGDIGTEVPSQPGTYTDVTTTGAGYKDASTGAIFQSSAGRSAIDHAVKGWRVTAIVAMITGFAVVGGAVRTVL
ncbi:uncharacterized protein UMAG_01949 [Mycosarcoma maydis]|uniref:Uncharacterized protein n=1 Tax=Mycosarcoma maydis TaxID=5270 RepID=A0A0D1CWL9_MYCMD|nr:uncharacterized protein UMAG_01949 [Ustilago maydis 521]KIS70798.1 hypothetical protein UMAG_01949 [Ustilago maydis 521]|eukprot:XP_011387869.1 hypothetical protein UMAG_01949 [Ustilago maydis 521]